MQQVINDFNLSKELSALHEASAKYHSDPLENSTDSHQEFSLASEKLKEKMKQIIVQDNFVFLRGRDWKKEEITCVKRILEDSECEQRGLTYKDFPDRIWYRTDFCDMLKTIRLSEMGSIVTRPGNILPERTRV